MENKKPPARPKPNVSTVTGGEFVFEWSEDCQDWMPVYKSQNWLDKLFGIPPEPVIVYPKDKRCS